MPSGDIAFPTFQFLHSPSILHIPLMPVEINRLALDSSQLEAIQCIYSEECEVKLRFSDSTRDWQDAQDFLRFHLLNYTL